MQICFCDICWGLAGLAVVVFLTVEDEEVVFFGAGFQKLKAAAFCVVLTGSGV